VDHLRSNRPEVTVHYAQTLDGRIATRTGQSQWIGGEASLRFAHQLRAQHDAVMVGVGTVLADNPRLTVRLVEGRSPLRVVLDSTLRIPLDSTVLTDGAAPTLIATTPRAPSERVDTLPRPGVDLLVIGEDEEGHVDLAELLTQLKDRGTRSVLLEGGRQLITTALRERLVDRLVVCISPLVLGSGIDAVGDLGVDRLAEALTFTDTCFSRLGDDIIFDGTIRRVKGEE
jgi:5-amino-6-(5-phosphoribosylamino)uracil reductase/diaminohydroxyphosphoribosylaminopyrimidine deaminase/5-amino-6-(5-phosphoribosylamino)uracil reductase